VRRWAQRLWASWWRSSDVGRLKIRPAGGGRSAWRISRGGGAAEWDRGSGARWRWRFSSLGKKTWDGPAPGNGGCVWGGLAPSVGPLAGLDRCRRRRRFASYSGVTGIFVRGAGGSGHRRAPMSDSSPCWNADCSCRLSVDDLEKVSGRSVWSRESTGGGYRFRPAACTGHCRGYGIAVGAGRRGGVPGPEAFLLGRQRAWVSSPATSPRPPSLRGGPSVNAGPVEVVAESRPGACV